MQLRCTKSQYDMNYLENILSLMFLSILKQKT